MFLKRFWILEKKYNIIPERVIVPTHYDLRLGI